MLGAMTAGRRDNGHARSVHHGGGRSAVRPPPNGGLAWYGCPPPMTIRTRLPRVPAQFRSLYGGLLAISFLFGANFTALGAVLPQMIRAFDWSYTAAATVLAAGSFGYFGATFASGFIVRRIGLRVTAVIGLGLIAGALALFGATPALLVNVLLHGLVGVGSGCVEVVINYGAVRMERDGRSQLMNLLHAAFSVGGMLGPLAAARLLDAGSPWQTVFRIIAAGTALAAIWVALLPFHRLDEQPAPARPNTRRASEPPLDHLLVALCVALLFIYVGAEVGVSGWVAEYFVSVLGSSPAQGAILVTLFWGGILAGRLLLAFCYNRHAIGAGYPDARRSGRGRPDRGHRRHRAACRGGRLRGGRARILLHLPAGDVDRRRLRAGAQAERGSGGCLEWRGNRFAGVSVPGGRGCATDRHSAGIPAVRAAHAAADAARRRRRAQNPNPRPLAVVMPAGATRMNRCRAGQAWRKRG